MRRPIATPATTVDLSSPPTLLDQPNCRCRALEPSLKRPITLHLKHLTSHPLPNIRASITSNQTNMLWSDNKPFNHSTNQLINQLTNQQTTQASNHPINQLTNQKTTQASNHLINQSTSVPPISTNSPTFDHQNEPNTRPTDKPANPSTNYANQQITWK